MRPCALVTGATGALGPSLVRGLHQAGYNVSALVRMAPPPGLLPEACSIVVGDVTDRSALLRSMKGMEVVFHLAAVLHRNDPTPEMAAEYQRVNVDGTRNVMHAAVAAGARRVVYFSTIAVYRATRPGEIIDEAEAANAETLYAQTKRQAERVVLDARNVNGEPLGVVLRLAAVYGARIKGNYRSLLALVQRRCALQVGDGNNRRTLVHETDVVAASLLAAQHPAASGRVFNVTDGAVHSLADILDAMRAACGGRALRLRVPLPLAKAAASVLDAGLSAARRRPVAALLLEKITEDMAVSGVRLQALGYRPRMDLQSGWGITVRDYRNRIWPGE